MIACEKGEQWQETLDLFDRILCAEVHRHKIIRSGRSGGEVVVVVVGLVVVVVIVNGHIQNPLPKWLRSNSHRLSTVQPGCSQRSSVVFA